MLRQKTGFFVVIAAIILISAYVYLRYFNNNPLSLQQSQRFFLAVSIIKSQYVKPVSDQTLINHAIDGMLEGLDTYSGYLEPNDITYLQQSMTGNFGGIGVEVEFANDALKVITPLDDSPAQKAGILPNDEIIEINQQLVGSMTFLQAVQALRGTNGSKVSIVVVRPHEKMPIELELTRANLSMQNVRSRLLEKNIGYIRIASFQKNTAAEVQQSVALLDKQNLSPIKVLLLDLRNNPGGLLMSAVNVSDLFLSPQYLKNNNFDNLIVYYVNREGKSAFKASGADNDILNNGRLIILINHGSASAAEIVAGALRDYHRATLVGEQTYGKGSVQTVMPFDNNTSAIKLTTALYYTPAGHLIDHIGITPDIIVNTIPGEKQDMILGKALNIK